MIPLSQLGTPLRIGDVEIRNRVFLAPMSGVTDEPFRSRAYAHGAGLVVSEMVASGELSKGRMESERRIRRSKIPVHMVQLAGREPHHMAEAARIAVGEGADIIDINMGCPAKKVTGGYAGSALMREPDHALSLIEAVIGAVDVPVTVKMRLGWDETALNAPLLARRAEHAGVQMVTVHGRTRCQFYQGKADWRAIARVKESVSIPVVANGDVEECDLRCRGPAAIGRRCRHGRAARVMARHGRRPKSSKRQAGIPIKVARTVRTDRRLCRCLTMNQCSPFTGAKAAFARRESTSAGILAAMPSSCRYQNAPRS